MRKCVGGKFKLTGGRYPLKFEIAEKKVKTMLRHFLRRTTFIMSSYSFYAWSFCCGCYGASHDFDCLLKIFGVNVKI